MVFQVLLILFVLVFFFGLEAEETTQGQRSPTQPNASAQALASQATDFIIYKDALQNYVEYSNPQASGQVPSSSLGLPGSFVAPPGAGNYVTYSNGSYGVVAWYQPSVSGASLAPTLETSGGVMDDGTIGYNKKTTFYPYPYVIQMQGNPSLYSETISAAETMPVAPPADYDVVFYDGQTTNGQ